MRSAFAVAVLAAALAVPALADARPITAGVALGRIQSEVDAHGEAEDTRQIFARVGLTSRVSAQVELARIDSDYSTPIRSSTALVVVELGARGALVPIMLAGVGLDRADDHAYYASEGSHIEGGFGLEYRADGGLTLGADLRLGGRSVDNTGEIIPLDAGHTALYAPAMHEGEYRSGRIYAAIRF